MNLKFKKVIGTVVVYAVLLVFLIVALFPIYWMFVTSIKENSEMYNLVPTFWPTQVTGVHYQALFTKYKFQDAVLNSIIVSTVVAAISIVIGFLAAYSIARLQYKGRKWALKGTMYSYLMPKAVLFIPLYIVVSQLNVSNTLFSLILIYPTFTIPYVIWMLVSYLKTIPVELEEAARIDGCSRMQAMIRVVCPLAMPGIVSTLIIAFTLCWNEYLYAMVMIHSKAAKTIPLVMSEMVVADIFAWGPMMAGAVIASIPILIVYLVSSKQMAGGLVAGGVKG